MKSVEQSKREISLDRIEEVLVEINETIYSSKEEPVYNYNKEHEQIMYLQNRAYVVYDDKHRELEKKYKITEPERPKTLKELKRRLEAGEYTVRPQNYQEDAEIYPSLSSFLSWRTEEPDHKGYVEAEKKLNAVRVNVHDQQFVSYEAGLAALKAFEEYVD